MGQVDWTGAGLGHIIPACLCDHPWVFDMPATVMLTEGWETDRIATAMIDMSAFLSSVAPRDVIGYFGAGREANGNFKGA